MTNEEIIKQEQDDYNLDKDKLLQIAVEYHVGLNEKEDELRHERFKFSQFDHNAVVRLENELTRIRTKLKDIFCLTKSNQPRGRRGKAKLLKDINLIAGGW